MNPSSTNPPRNPSPQTARASGRSTLILLPVVFLLGVVLAGVWFKYGAQTAGGGPGLSGRTVDLLRHLSSPVEIRFYSVLPPGSAPEPLQDFSRRVDRLLSEFQAANDNKIHVPGIFRLQEPMRTPLRPTAFALSTSTRVTPLFWESPLSARGGRKPWPNSSPNGSWRCRLTWPARFSRWPSRRHRPLSRSANRSPPRSPMKSCG